MGFEPTNFQLEYWLPSNWLHALPSYGKTLYESVSFTLPWASTQ